MGRQLIAKVGDGVALPSMRFAFNHEITRALPKDLKSSLPSIKEIEAELTQPAKLPPKRPAARKKRNPSTTTGRT